MAEEPLPRPETLTRSEPQPAELRVQANGHILKVTFEDGVVGSVSSERLRDALPHSARPPFARHDVAILTIEQIQANAVCIGFDDGHDTGVYTWRMLRSLTTQ